MDLGASEPLFTLHISLAAGEAKLFRLPFPASLSVSAGKLLKLIVFLWPGLGFALLSVVIFVWAKDQ